MRLHPAPTDLLRQAYAAKKTTTLACKVHVASVKAVEDACRVQLNVAYEIAAALAGYCGGD